MNGHPFNTTPGHCSPQLRHLLLRVGLLLFGLIFLFTQSAFAAVAFRAATNASQPAASNTTITYVGAGDSDSGTGGNLTPTLPANLAANDLLLCFVASRDNTTPTMTGWTQRYSVPNGTDLMSTLFWKIAGTSESTPTITYTGTVGVVARCFAFRGINTTSPFDADFDNPSNVGTVNNDDKMTTGSLINATQGAMILIAGAANEQADTDNGVTIGGGLTWSYPGIFSPYNAPGFGNRNTVALGLAYAGRSASGTSIGPLSLDTDRKANTVAVVLALKPAIPGSGILAISKPAGTTTNDAMIATIAIRPCSNTSGGDCTTTITPPTGWTKVRDIDTKTGGGTGGYGSRHFIYRRIATATEPTSYGWSIGGTPVHAGANGGILSFSGVDPTNPIVAENGQTTPNAYTHTAPSIDTDTITGTMLVSSHSVNSSGTWSFPTGMNEAVDIASLPTPDSLGIALEINYELRAASGPTGSRTATLERTWSWGGYTPSSDTGAAHLLALRPTTSETLNHIRIGHDGLASACAPETISIKACADATCSSLYLGSVTVNLSDIGTWSTDPVTFSGGQTTVTLATSGPVTLGGTATSPTATNATTCYNTTTATNDCALNFSSASFAFDVPDHTSATSQIVTITACASDFANKTRSVKFWSTYIDPASGTKQGLVVKGTGNTDCTTGYSPLGTSEAGATTLSLDFGSGSSPQATFSLCYPDVGKVQLDAHYDGSSTNSPPDAGVVVLGNDSFIAKPYGFTLSAIKQTATPQLVNPAASDASGAKFVKAGEAFTATVTARNFKNETTPNFGKESSPEWVKLTASLIPGLGLIYNPSVGRATTGSISSTSTTLTVTNSAGFLTGNRILVKGAGLAGGDLVTTITAIPSTTEITLANAASVTVTGVPVVYTFSSFNNGSATGTNFTWDEVGIITLTPYIGDGDYLGTLDLACKTPTDPNYPCPSSIVGRFFPHHFDLGGAAITNRSDAGCSPASLFTYMGEPMNVSFTLTAKNATSVMTQNYAGNFAKFTSTPSWTTYGTNDSLGLWMNVTNHIIPLGSCTVLFGSTTPFNTSFSCIGGTTPADIPRTAGPRVFALSSSVCNSLSDAPPCPLPLPSSGAVKFTADVRLERANSPDGRYLTLNLGITPQDGDGVTLLSTAFDLDADNDATFERKLLGTTEVRFGRLVLQNAYGPETEAIKMRLLTQYYNGTSFTTNPDDTCTKYSATAIAPAPNPLTCLELIGPVTCADVTAAGTDVRNGQYFTLSAPKKTGTLRYTLAVDSWLRYKWDGASDYNENPSARANFGIYRGNDRIINWREVIR